MKIGIVTVSFNQASFLEEAIDSVATVDPTQLRYVIVDPGSTDGSRDIIELHRARFSRVIFEPDRGAADGLNKGFAACDADILGYINSDDRFTAGALDWVLRFFATHPETDLLLGAIRIIDAKGRVKLRGRAPEKLEPRTFSYRTCYAWQQATFFRRELFERTRGFNIHNKVTWDGELIADMMLAGARVAYTNTILGDFRIYPSSITGSQRLALQLQESYAVLEQRVIAAGLQPMSAFEQTVRQVWHRVNPARHVRSVCGVGIHLPHG